MKIKVTALLLIFGSFFLVTCKKDDDPDTRIYPRINTIDVIDINESGATFRAEIINLGNSGIKDYGFVWDGFSLPTILSTASQKSLGAATKTGPISITVQSNLVTGKKYKVRAYATDGKYTMYGQVITFTSLGSLAPKITGFSPESGTVGDTITITGSNFGSAPAGVVVKFGSETAFIISASETEVKAVVPNTIRALSTTLSLTVAEQTFTAPKDFILLTPSISSFSPQKGNKGDIVTIKGTNFGSSFSGLEISFGNTRAQVQKAGMSEIQVIVPATFEFSTSVNISVKVVGQTLNFTAPFYVQTAWTQKADFTGSINTNPSFVFSTKNKGYVGMGLGELWEYDPLSDQWTQKANFPGENRTSILSFAINDKGYAGTGSIYENTGLKTFSDFWEYNPLTNGWTRKTDFGGGTRTEAVGFAIGTKGYVGTGYTANSVSGDNGLVTDFWEYNPDLDSWSKKKDFAGGARQEADGFSSNSKGYVGGGGYGSGIALSDLWEYNPATDAWIQKQGTIPVSLYNQSKAFSINEKRYYPSVNQGSPNIWEYNATINQWTKRNYFPQNKSFAFTLPIGEKGYFGIGYDGNQSLKDFWEFDPTK